MEFHLTKVLKVLDRELTDEEWDSDSESKSEYKKKKRAQSPRLENNLAKHNTS